MRYCAILASLIFALCSVTAMAEGNVVDNHDGTFTFNPGIDFQDLAPGKSRTVSFTYAAIDDSGLANATSSAGIVTITVSGANGAPRAQDDAGRAGRAADLGAERPILRQPAGRDRLSFGKRGARPVSPWRPGHRVIVVERVHEPLDQLAVNLEGAPWVRQGVMAGQRQGHDDSLGVGLMELLEKFQPVVSAALGLVDLQQHPEGVVSIQDATLDHLLQRLDPAISIARGVRR